MAILPNELTRDPPFSLREGQSSPAQGKKANVICSGVNPLNPTLYTSIIAAVKIKLTSITT